MSGRGGFTLRGLATLALAGIPCMALVAIARWVQRPVAASPDSAPVAKAEDALILIAPGDPSWTGRRPADAVTTASPVVYNTEIIARDIGDELALRGITVRIESTTRVDDPADLLGHDAVLIAFPARRWHLGAGVQGLLDGAWEAAARDQSEALARPLIGAVVIAATPQLGRQAESSLQAVLEQSGTTLADSGVFLTTLTGQQVAEKRRQFAGRIAERLRMARQQGEGE